jgi:hypothetical protein
VPDPKRATVRCKQCDQTHYPVGIGADQCDTCRRQFSSAERGNAYCERHYLAANRPAPASVFWLQSGALSGLRVLWLCSICFAERSRAFSDVTSTEPQMVMSRDTVGGACGHENPPQNRFCDTCGTRLDSACPACGSTNRAESKFCGHCGASLAARAGATDQQAPRLTDEPRRDTGPVPVVRPSSFYKDWDSNVARSGSGAEDEIGPLGNFLISFAMVVGSLGVLFIFMVLALDNSMSDGQRLVLWMLLLSYAGPVGVGWGLLRRAKIALYALYVSCGLNAFAGLVALASQQGQLMVQGLLGLGFSALWFFYFHKRAHLFE